MKDACEVLSLLPTAMRVTVGRSYHGESKCYSYTGVKGKVYVYVREDVLAAEKREGRLLGVAGLQQVTHVLLRAPEDSWILVTVYRSCEGVYILPSSLGQQA